MLAVRKDEPLGKSSSLVASVVAVKVSGGVYGDIGWGVLQSSAVSMSVFSGFSCWMVARSFAWMRSARAFSAGPNTRARSLVRFAFLLLARAPLAMLCGCVGRRGGYAWELVGGWVGGRVYVYVWMVAWVAVAEEKSWARNFEWRWAGGPGYLDYYPCARCWCRGASPSDADFGTTSQREGSPREPPGQSTATSIFSACRTETSTAALLVYLCVYLSLALLLVPPELCTPGRGKSRVAKQEPHQIETKRHRHIFCPSPRPLTAYCSRPFTLYPHARSLQCFLERI
jgi:hypothetical protein